LCRAIRPDAQNSEHQFGSKADATISKGIATSMATDLGDRLYELTVAARLQS
jgi:hypothetical protein